MDILLDYGIQLMELLGPTLVAILTVPVMTLVKKGWTWVGKWPPWAQQITVVLVAALFTELGTFLNMALPSDVMLFTEETWGALLSAAMAMGIHAGQRAKAVSDEVDAGT